MKTYKLVKQLPGIISGTIFTYEKFDGQIGIELVEGGITVGGLLDFIKGFGIDNDFFEEIKPKSIYDLKVGDEYYNIVTVDINRITYDNDLDDEKLINTGNAFLTKKEAEKELQKRKALQNIKKWIWKNDGGYNFNPLIKSYYIYLDFTGDKLRIGNTIGERYLNEILYSSLEIAQKSMKELEKEYKILFDIYE